jgi:hypothetical protein
MGLTKVEGLGVPDKYKNTNANAAIKFSYFLQMHANVYTGNAFIGRTYVGKLLELDPATYKLKEQGSTHLDWLIINTKLIDPKVKPIIEFSIVIKQTKTPAASQQPSGVAPTAETVGRVGIGFTMIPLFEGTHTTALTF